MTFTDLSEKSTPVSGEPHVVSTPGISGQLLIYPADENNQIVINYLRAADDKPFGQVVIDSFLVPDDYDIPYTCKVIEELLKGHSTAGDSNFYLSISASAMSFVNEVKNDSNLFNQIGTDLLASIALSVHDRMKDFSVLNLIREYSIPVRISPPYSTFRCLMEMGDAVDPDSAAKILAGNSMSIESQKDITALITSTDFSDVDDLVEVLSDSSAVRLLMGVLSESGGHRGLVSLVAEVIEDLGAEGLSNLRHIISEGTWESLLDDSVLSKVHRVKLSEEQAFTELKRSFESYSTSSEINDEKPESKPVCPSYFKYLLVSVLIAYGQEALSEAIRILDELTNNHGRYMTDYFMCHVAAVAKAVHEGANDVLAVSTLYIYGIPIYE
jgi:hypothetical protein